MCTLNGKLLLGLFEHEGLNTAIKRTSHGNATTLSQLKQILHTGSKLN